jgi:hypothetical protein
MDTYAHQRPGPRNGYHVTFFANSPNGASLALGFTWNTGRKDLQKLTVNYMGKNIPFPLDHLTAPDEPAAEPLPAKADWKTDMMRGVREAAAKAPPAKRGWWG